MTAKCLSALPELKAKRLSPAYPRIVIIKSILMFKELKHFIASFMLISIIFVSCLSNNDGILKVRNSSPRILDKEYAVLEKLYSIDVTQISMFGKESSQDFEKVIDFDKNNNMYILDVYESTISVFNENGELVRTFGGKGQGPREFLRPNTLIIKKDKIYVFQGFFEYKIVNLEGEYISSGNINIENPLRYEIVGDNFYILRGKTDRTFTKLEFILLKIEDDNFSKSKEIFKYEYPPGLRGLNYDFIWSNWLLISNNGEFYFPEDNFNEFSIIKYNKEGEAALSFSRKYNKKEYSKEARDRFYSIYEQQIKKGDMEFRQSPPVVRNMFQDDKRNIWVISGETYEDNGNPNYENTIDIFNEKGEWLYSFKSKLLSISCFYHDGKIYRVLPINLETYNQYIEVYKIKYPHLRSSLGKNAAPPGKSHGKD